MVLQARAHEEGGWNKFITILEDYGELTLLSIIFVLHFFSGTSSKETKLVRVGREQVVQFAAQYR